MGRLTTHVLDTALGKRRPGVLQQAAGDSPPPASGTNAGEDVEGRRPPQPRAEPDGHDAHHVSPLERTHRQLEADTPPDHQAVKLVNRTILWDGVVGEGGHVGVVDQGKVCA